ncbi:MAG: DUF4468 domain-containing protein [Prevotellaceae bacterium]|nr:DUF4468 domain-containing protein [Prevotellaceae bacterium]
MKRILLLVMCAISFTAYAQNVWEKPENTSKKANNVEKEKEEKPNPDAKYLAGAVPEVDGRVEWSVDMDVPGKSAEEIYNTVLDCLTDLTNTDNQLEGSQVALVNKQEHIIVANIREWLVFKDNFISLDRSEFYYKLMAYCRDGGVTVKMNRLSYRYEPENNNNEVLKAEELINDKTALNRKKTKIYPGMAKFRRKTVDRKDELFAGIKRALGVQTQSNSF